MLSFWDLFFFCKKKAKLVGRHAQLAYAMGPRSQFRTFSMKDAKLAIVMMLQKFLFTLSATVHAWPDECMRSDDMLHCY